MSWPTETISREHVDEGSDDPRLFRADLDKMVQGHNAMVAGRSNADGVAPLDANALIPASSLPIVPLERGGTNATTQAGAQFNLGLGDSAVRNVDVPNGVVGLNANNEMFRLYQGASAAPTNYVLTAGQGWVDPAPGANAVSRTAFKTAMGAFSAAPPTGSFANIVLPGGSWGLYPIIEKAPGTHQYSAQMTYESTAEGQVARLGIFAQINSGNQDVARGQQRYFLASPPYDLGDGECEDFLFLEYTDKHLTAMYFACDPPWAYNGPTDIRRGIRMKTMEELADPEVRDQYFEDMVNGRLEPVAEGHELKNWDMPVIPHPFGRKSTVALVDPMGDEIRQIREFAHYGYSPSEFIHSGQLTIDNEPLKRCGPPGVPVVRARWKRTR